MDAVRRGPGGRHKPQGYSSPLPADVTDLVHTGRAAVSRRHRRQAISAAEKRKSKIASEWFADLEFASARLHFLPAGTESCMKAAENR